MHAIVAIDMARGIGKHGDLLTRISADLKRFKSLTLGKTNIYGRKTLETFPGGKVLPGRKNWILSRQLENGSIEGAEIFNSEDKLLERIEKAKSEGETDFIVIGGASIYELLLPYCDECWITRIRANFGADAFFPDLKTKGFELSDCGEWQKEGLLHFRYELWKRN